MKMYEQRGHDSEKGDVFAYDEFRRLTGVKIDSPEPTTPETTQFEKSWNATYDKVDNILNIVKGETGQPDETIQPAMDKDTSKLNQYSEFDGWGLDYDGKGNLWRKGGQTFYYDYRNRLTSALEGGVTTRFTYDALGRRIEKTTGPDTIKYYYDGNNVIEERDGSDQIRKQFVYGNLIDEPLIIVNFDGGTQTDYYVHTNGIGSVTAITNQNGDLFERVSYDTFGMPTFTNAANQPLSASSIGNDILFQGRRYDKETNLYYYRARYYDPIMGRFLQTDPMGYKDSMNLYQALNMNPVNLLDPFGLAIIVIDPGHGDIYDIWLDPGATGIDGKKPHEKDLALNLAKKIGSELEKLGHTIFYTREGDINRRQERFAWRANISNNKNADFFISIHLNSFDKNKNYFMAAYTSNKGKVLAESIAESVHYPDPYIVYMFTGALGTPPHWRKRDIIFQWPNRNVIEF